MNRTGSMKLGVLGIDQRIAQAVTAAIARGDSVAMACDLRDDDPNASVVGPDVPRDSSWEAVLDARACDAVLVGAGDWNERRAEGVRALVQAGRTLLLSHPLVLSMLWAYELDMIRADSGARIIPFLPERLHPFIDRLRTRIEAGLAGAAPSGAVETVTLERRLVDRSRAAVLAALARDADLVRALTGDPSRLSTLGGGDTDSAWGSLAVGFSGPEHLPVRWQAGRGDPPGLRITATTAAGSCSIDIPDGPGLPWVWTDRSQAGERTEKAGFDAGAIMLDRVHRVTHATAVPPATWSDAARAVELAETVPRSLAKGRAIDLHQEEFSEMSTFRGTMASLGCGLVLGALMLLLLATLVAGIARAAGWPFAERVAGAWPQIVLAVLGLFLALQLLPLLIGAGRPSGDPPSPARRHE